MRLCNHCKTTYPPGVSVCPRDGEETVSVSSGLLDGNDPFLGQFAGSYRLTKKLGEGGMGSVYLGEHPTLKKNVAVKILHAEYAQKKHIVERFFAEARAVSQIGHPNIVDVQDFGALEVAGNLPFILMEYLDGESLQDLLNREKKIAPKLAVSLVLQLLDALGAAHQKGIVHRDLKPDNIFLLKRPNGEYHIKLLDFGIAKLLDQKLQEEGKQLTQAGTVVGTPQYMSPEQAQGHVAEIDPRSDLYGVGVILFELLCGVLPFPESSFGDLVIAHVMKPPPSPRSFNPALSRELDQCILKALQKKREDRYQSAEEMATALRRAPIAGTGVLLLDDVLQSSMGFVPPPTTLSGLTGEVAPAPLKRRKLAFFLLAGSGTALGVFLAFLFWGGAGLLTQKTLEETPVAAVLPQSTLPTFAASLPTEPASTSLPLPEEPAPAVQLTFLSEPKKALVSVQIDGGEPVELGEAPARLEVPEGAQVEVSFFKNGVKWTERFTADEPREVIGKLSSVKEVPGGKKGGLLGNNKSNKGNTGNGKLGNKTVCPYDDC